MYFLKILSIFCGYLKNYIENAIILGNLLVICNICNILRCAGNMNEFKEYVDKA